jgi:hypothetical protein
MPADLLHNIWIWLTLPPTWVAVVLPALLTAGFFWRQPPKGREWLFMLLGVVAGLATAEMVVRGGDSELHWPPLFTGALLVLTGLRLYIPATGKAFGMCWLVLIVTDTLAAAWHGTSAQVAYLPLGIGGAGVGDGLFFEPMMLALGLLLMKAERERSIRKAIRAANAQRVTG